MDSIVNREFPEGIFSKKSYEKIEESYDELLGKFMREYWQSHPEELERITNKLENV